MGWCGQELGEKTNSQTLQPPWNNEDKRRSEGQCQAGRLVTTETCGIQPEERWEMSTDKPDRCGRGRVKVESEGEKVQRALSGQGATGTAPTVGARE